MIGKVVHGRRVGGLVRYLFGPGRANEHINPRVVAGWDDPSALEPPITAQDKRDFRPLIDRLNTPLAGASRVPEQCVWHLPLRTAPGDRTLSDEEWADVAAEVMDRTGLARRGDDGGCRWVAIRHADDHVHLVVTLARQDGRPASTSNDYYRVGQACHVVEERYGLAVTAGRDRTAAHRATRAETEKAGRLDKPAIGRDVLRLEVQTAAAGAGGEGEFFARLEAAGVMVGKRFSVQNPAEVTGYKVALPGSMGGLHTADGQPVWYSGGKLAADLSLPKLRAHWQAPAPAAPAGPGRAERTSPRLRLRHEVERAAGGARSPEEFFAGLRDAGVLVRERFSQLRPEELTGYAVALPGDRDGQGEPMWRGGGSLAPELSLPRLRARWGDTGTEGTTSTSPRRAGTTTRLGPEERRQAWQEARQATEAATEEVRRLRVEDPDAAADPARSAADVLRVAARAGEPGGKGPLHDAARTYDRASREPYGRAVRRTPAGADLRLAATTLALLARAGRDDGAALIALVVSLGGLLDAVAELRATQARGAQALAASGAAGQLRQVAGPPGAPPQRGRPPQGPQPPTAAPRRPWRPEPPPPPQRGR